MTYLSTLVEVAAFVVLALAAARDLGDPRGRRLPLRERD